MSSGDTVKRDARDGLFSKIKLERSASIYNRAVEWTSKKWAEALERLDQGQDSEEPSDFFQFILSSNLPASIDNVLLLADKFVESSGQGKTLSPDLALDDDEVLEKEAAAATASAAAPEDNDVKESAEVHAAPAEIKPESAEQEQEQEQDSPLPSSTTADGSPSIKPKVQGFVVPAKKSGFVPPSVVSAPTVSSLTSGNAKGKGKSKPAKPAEAAAKPKTAKAPKEPKAAKEGSKPKKDPLEPKGGRNAYIIFTSEQRPGYVAQNPTDSSKEIITGLAAMWKALSDAEKSPYTKRATEEKERQDLLKEEYKAANPNSALATAKPKAKGVKNKASDDTASSSKSKKAKKTKLTFGEEDDEMAGGDADNGEGDQENLARGHLKRNAAPTSDMNVDCSSDIDDDDDQMDVSPAVKTPPVKKVKKVADGPKSKPKSAAFSVPNKAMEHERVGIKQHELGAHEDLLHSDMLPNIQTEFPPEDVQVETAVVVILAPYRDFVSSQQQAMSEHELSLVQQICTYNAEFVVATVKSIRKPSNSSNLDQDDESGELNLVTVTTDQGRVFTILHIVYTSPLLTGDRFLINKTLFDESMKYPFLEIGSPVRRIFAADEGDSTPGKEAEWQEGTVYHTDPDMATHPYNSISVVWVSQEKGTNEWFYNYSQFCNECSPWDLAASAFQRRDHKYKPFQLPKALAGVGTLSPSVVLDFLSEHSAAHLFDDPMASISAEFREMFPEKKDQLDLKLLKSNCSRGRYEGNIGITTLFRDIDIMVTNGKKFNESNREFLPWRQIDMFEKHLALVKSHIASKHNIQSLRESVQEDRTMKMELEMESREV